MQTASVAEVPPRLENLKHAASFTLTEQDKAVCRRQVADELSDDEFELFWQFCLNRRLNPITGQVFPVMRRKRENEQWVRYMTITTSIDGLVAIADRTRCYAPSDKPSAFEWRAKEANKAQSPYPLSCTVWVKKYAQGEWHEYPATVRWDELVPLEKKGASWEVGYMWAKMPTTMIEKCALAKALRRGFPEDLGGIYISEEMEQASSQEKRQAAQLSGEGEDEKGKRRGKLKASKEPNRGHDDTGMEQVAGATKPETPKVEDLPDGLHPCPDCEGGYIDKRGSESVHLAGEAGEPSDCPGRADVGSNTQRRPLPDGPRTTFFIEKIDYKSKSEPDPDHPNGKREKRYIFVNTKDKRTLTCFREHLFPFLSDAFQKKAPVEVVTKTASGKSTGKTYINIEGIAKIGDVLFDLDGPVMEEAF